MGSSLPDVKRVNINHKGSLQEATSRYFHEIFKKKIIRNFFLSILTIGVYPYKIYKKTKHKIAQAIAARKLFFFNILRGMRESWQGLVWR